MRLWHETLVPHLPRPQLLGQHRECCALRGGGWKKPHSTVNYIWGHGPGSLFLYHLLVMTEMNRRQYNVDPLWRVPAYRGKKCAKWDHISLPFFRNPIYPEHNTKYLSECLENLREKGVNLGYIFDRFQITHIH